MTNDCSFPAALARLCNRSAARLCSGAPGSRPPLELLLRTQHICLQPHFPPFTSKSAVFLCLGGFNCWPARTPRASTPHPPTHPPTHLPTHPSTHLISTVSNLSCPPPKARRAKLRLPGCRQRRCRSWPRPPRRAASPPGGSSSRSSPSSPAASPPPSPSARR